MHPNKDNCTIFTAYYKDGMRQTFDFAIGYKSIIYSQSYVIPLKINGRKKFNYIFLRDKNFDWIPYNQDTMKQMAPWRFTDIHQNFDVETNTMKPRVYIGQEKYFLDAHGNLVDDNGNILKQNPYTLRKEATEPSEALVEEFTRQVLSEGV